MNMKSFLINISIAAAVALSMSSCEDFLTREPTNSVPASSYFATENDLKLYCNGLIESYLPSFTSVALNGEDSYSDLVATKSGSDFYHPGLWNASKQTGWSSGNFSFIRSCNYMLDNMGRAKGKVTDDIYNHYEGVARFWRAYGHFSKVMQYGNTPWLDHVLQKDDSILYVKRDDREYVMHKVLEDMDFAATNCLATPLYFTSGRTSVNKWVVLAYKARLCLFEAAYRKYHSTNPSTGEPWNNKYESADDFYNECISACEEIMKSGVFKLHNTGKPQTDFSELFKSETIPTDEVIWSRQASEEMSVTHNVTWYFRSATYGQKYSPTKDLVDMFLTLDGTPIETDEVSVSDEFTNRDWRLCQTVSGPGYTYTPLTGTAILRGPDFSCCIVGYEFNKWCIDNALNYSSSLSNNSVPILRYGEVLLDYAEAKAETGGMTEEIWAETIGALRQRAGVTNVYPGSAGYKKDTFLSDYYKVEGQTPLSDLLLEIRRERVTELCYENGTRGSDLKRWALGSFIAKRYNNQGWRGIYLTADEVKKGFKINGYDYTISTKTTSTSYALANSGADATWSLSKGSYGYLIYNYKLEWADKMYLDPIPKTAFPLNENLDQNFGWN